MKKLMLTLVLLMSVICGAMAQNDAMYVYRNDGVINAFLKADVDSMRYSQLDLDSVLHNDYVVQEVWAVDSVYRIPLAVIDSVSFVTPETVYQPGTVNVTSDMRAYIIASDSLMLTFAPNTPKKLLPQIGDKLVNTEASGGLLSGFVGQVRKIENTGNGYSVYCDAIDLTDVFECYYGMCSGGLETSQSVKTRGVKDGFYQGKFEWNPGKLTRNLISTMGSRISYEPDGNLLVPSLDDAEISFSLTPKIYGSAFLIINREYGVNLNISIYGDYTLEEYMALTGSITGGGDLKFIEKPIPIPEVLCDVDVEFGAFLRSGFQISTEQKWTQRYKSTFHYEWSSKGMESLKNVNDIRNVDNTHSGIVALKGVFEGGLYAKVGLSFIATSQLDIAEVGLRLEGGMRFEGTALPYISNKEDALKSTDLYNMMKGQGVELSAYYGTSAYANLFSWSWNKPIPNWGNIPFGKKWVLKSCYYVLEFKNTKLEKEDNDYFASFDIFGNCGKTDIGFSLQCKDNPVDRVNGYSVYDYNGPSSSAYATFYKKPSKEPFIVYPLVKFGELEMIAEPSAEVKKKECTAHITDFKQTGSHYSQGGYSNDGRTYDYKYDVSTTVEIESLEGISDWGYVYKDPYGNIKRISLMGHGTSYTDTRYAYYRNESKSTACLYGYVKYEGDDEYYYGEPHDYPLEYAVHSCPDSNHPHAIDLGLPSGTKWCCMNVGASSPEQPGGFYAWGETSEKSVYNDVTYKYVTGEDTDGDGWYDQNRSDQNIGSDIAGTSYDVAHVRMGGSWRMPSLAQQQELINNCTRTWTQQNGTNGILVTGKNGGQLFLPAAGGRWSGDLGDAGSIGYYWSSSLGLYHDSYYLYFYSRFWGRDCYNYRSVGHSVRAVCP